MSVKETIAKNILFYRKSKKLSQKALAEKVGVNNSAISNWENGINSIDIETLFKVCNVLNVSIDTMFGNDNIDRALNDNDQTYLANYKKLDNYGRQMVDAIINLELKRIEQQNKEYPNPQSATDEMKNNVIELRMSELKASAGTGNLLSDEVIKYIQVQLNHTTRQADFCIPVSGDSMQPKFYDGDILLVRSQPDIDIGEVGIYIVNSNGFVKQKGSDRLISLNKEYDDILLSEFDNIKCCGKVIGKLDKEWICIS